MNKRTITPCVFYGIEYRMFLLSGMTQVLQDHGARISVLKKDVPNAHFDSYVNGMDVHLLQLGKLGATRTRVENYFLKIRQSRMRLKGIGTFKNYNQKSNALTWKDYLFGNEFVYGCLRLLTQKQIHKHYVNKTVQEKLLNMGTTDILLAGYSSAESILLAVNARSLGIKIWCMVNSWKDLYINDFLPFQMDGLFVWSDQMRGEYLRLNTHMEPSHIYAYGNPVFDRFFEYKPHFEKTYYEDKYGISKDRTYILYSMLDPDRYEHEHRLIKKISDGLSKVYAADERPYIVVRKNPFDRTDRVDEFFRHDTYIRVAEHFSLRNKEDDFFVQGMEGEIEWLDLLYYAAMNMGAASTVALESIMLSKPVITIGFDESGQSSLLMKEMAQAPFYKALLEREDVLLSMSLEECLNEVLKVSTSQTGRDALPEILGCFDGKAVENISHIILERE